MKNKNLYIYYFLILIIFLVTKNIQSIKLNKNSNLTNSSDFSEPTDSPVFPDFLVTKDSEESELSEEIPIDPTDSIYITNPTESSDSYKSEIPESSESSDSLEPSDSLNVTIPIEPSDSLNVTIPIEPSDSSYISYIPSDSSEIIVYEPVIIYNLSMNETNNSISTKIQLNRVEKTNRTEEDLEAYIGLEFNIESFNEITLEIITDGVPIQILFYESDNIDEIINNTIEANKSFINQSSIRTFDLLNISRYYFKIIQDTYDLETMNETYIINITLKNDPYNKIDDNFYNKTRESCTFYYKRDKEIMFDNKNIILTLLSSSMNDFNISYSVFGIDDGKRTATGILLNKTFFNGYSLIINDSLFGDDKKEKYIEFELLLEEDNHEFIQIKSRIIDKNNIIGINNPIDIEINDEIKEECFLFKQTNEKDSTEYILNFLSLTKNINFSLWDSNKSRKLTNFEIDIESMTKKMEIKNNNWLCFNLSNEENFGSLSFEIKPLKNKDGDSIVIPNNYTIRDLWTRHYLFQGTASLYKPEVFNIDESLAKISFHIIKGYPLLYIVYCNSTNSINSNCSFNESKIIEMKNYQDINGFISEKKELAENLTALVYCPSNNNQGCEFDIEIKNDNEDTYLFPNFRIHTFYIKDKEETYKINAKDINSNYLCIDINSFLTKPEVEIYTDNLTDLSETQIEKFYTENNKLSYQIPSSKIKIKKYLFIKIKGKANLYYGINFQLKSEVEAHIIENNVLYYYQSEKTNQTFELIIDKDESSYIVNLNTFGNDLILKINGNNEDKKPYNDLIQAKLNKNDHFIIENKNTNSQKYLFNIEYHKMSEHNKIFIENGFLYKNRINTDNPEAIYYFILFEEDDTENIIINFRKVSEILMHIEINSIENDNNLVNKTVEQLSKIIVLDKAQIKCNGNKNNYAKYCEYVIKIKLNDDSKLKNNNFDFSIQLTKNGNNDNLIFLPQNTFMSNLLIYNSIQNYYFEINREHEGKIYIDFLEGQGYASGIIKGDNYEDILEFDYINRYFNIDNKKTTYCINSCKIYINLYLSDKYQDKEMYKYNIYSKFNYTNNDIFYFNVPETEYIYGNLEDNSIDYYKTNITKSKKTAFYVYCDDCLINITDQNNTLIKQSNILLKDIVEIESNNKNFELKYQITNNELVSKQRYSIRIISYESNNKELLIPMDSIRNTFCQIHNNKPCQFLVPKESYNNITKMIFLVPKFEDAKIILENGKNNYEKSNNQYLEYNINEDEEDQIFRIKVELNYDANITFVSLHYKLIDKSMNYTYPEDYSIINLENNNFFNISPLISQGFLHYDINLAKGKGHISSPNIADNYFLEYGIKDNLNLLFEYNSKYEFQITSEEENSIFYFRIIANNNSSNNLVEMNFQKTNYFKYLNSDSNSKIWPLNFFMEINIGSDDVDLKDINFNYKFWRTYNNMFLCPFNESYKSEIYLVDRSFIVQNKYNDFKNEGNDKLKSISKYRYDFTMGYDLIEFNTIIKEINNNKDKIHYYLLISIDYTQNLNEEDNRDINFVLTAFDFSKNYILPMNEYLFMLINKPREIKIGNQLATPNNNFIEYVLKDIKYTIDSQESSSEDKIYGKTFLNLNQNQTYIMNLTNFSENKEEMPNVLIRHGLSIDNNYSYFIIKNSSINYSNYTYNNSNGTISFEPVVKNPKISINDNINDSYIIYTIKLFQVEHELSFNTNYSIYETQKKPIKMFKYIPDNNNETNSLNISINISLGYYYIYVLAEARKGNVYEYLAYKPLYIEKIADELIENITIENIEKQYIPQYTREVKYRVSNISWDANDFIKLSLKHPNFDDKNEIYVSDTHLIWNSSNLYKDSLFKVIDRETSLIIPVKEVSNSPLFIKIPCDGLCDYTLHYVQYKNDNISINNNECFDIDLLNNASTFYYKLNDINETSLITATSNKLTNFTMNIESGSFYSFKNSYFNGYSILFDSNESTINKELKFKISKLEDFRIIKICHRFITEINDNIEEAKKIFVGDIKYSRFDKKKDCFSIYKNDTEEIETNYRLNFIRKSNSLKLTLYKKNDFIGDQIQIPDETSFSYDFNSSYYGFCISTLDQASTLDNSLLFQLLSISNSDSKINPLVIPLIKGISTKQKLRKGEISYYRINENNIGSKYIRVYFQALSGSLNIYHGNCSNYPNCSFEIEDFNNFIKLELNHNNIYYNIEIKEEDIYQKSEFPIVIVYCAEDNNDNDDCNYYIEMSNDNEVILLNQNRKIYSFIESEKETHSYHIEIPKNDNNNNLKDRKLYIQLHNFTGESTLNIENQKYSETNDHYNLYNENGMFYFINISGSNDNKFDININGNNSMYSLFYYITDGEDNNFYLPSGEVHYCMISKSKTSYSYHFQDYSKKTDNNYIVSLNSINCDLNIGYRNTNKKGRNLQFEINNTESINVSSDLDVEDKCEFTISAVELLKGGNTSELIFNDRTYQYYEFSNSFNTVNIDYLISKNDLLNKEIYITLKNKLKKKISIFYNNEEHIVNDYNQIINLNEFNNNNIQEFNIYHLKITIKSEENVSFKFKINGNKDKYSYLDIEEIEYESIKKKEINKYYYEYFNSDKNLQVYLDSKGLARFDNIFIKYGVKKSDNEYLFINNNYINLNNTNCLKGCKIYFSIVGGEYEFNNYRIYILSNYKSLYVQNNINYYGNIFNDFSKNKNNNKNHFFETTIFDNQILFNLNCLYCQLVLYKDNSYKNKLHTIEKFDSIELNDQTNIYFSIERTNDGDINKNNFYYYFSIITKNTTRYINQKESNICDSVCNFILPLYSFYSYTSEYIVFYIPENDNAIINGKINSLNNNYDNFDLKDEDQSIFIKSKLTNRLMVNLTQLKNKNTTIEFEVVCINSNCNFIISDFYNSSNNYMNYPQNILISNNNKNKDVLEHKKIKAQLINGSGIISSNNKNYSLDYEIQEIVYILNEYANKNMGDYYSTSEEDFIFYLNIEKDNKYFDLKLNKTTYLKISQKNGNSKNLDFYLNIDDIQNKELYINYHFSKLEMNTPPSIIINSSLDTFDFSIKGNKIDFIDNNDKEKNNKDKYAIYVQEQRRGYIFLNSSVNNNKNITLFVEPNKKNFYEDIYLEVTPIYIEKDIIIPKNVYLEFKHNNQNIIFSKPNYDYHNVKCEIMFKNITNITSNNQSISVKGPKFGKYYFSINDTSLEYNLKIIKNETNNILIKCVAKKNDINLFYIEEENDDTKLFSTVDVKISEKKGGISNITHNILTFQDKNYKNYKITYLIRLYNVLDYVNDNEVNNLLGAIYSYNTYRKELTEDEINLGIITYDIKFSDLDFGEYRSSIIAEVYYNESFEYFFYGLKKCDKENNKTIKFDSSWIVPLVIVILIFILLVAYLIKAYINQKKEIKTNNSEDRKFLTNKITLK